MDWSDGDTWSALLPFVAESDVAEYFFRAKAVNGKTNVRPLPAPEAYFQVYVESTVSDVVDHEHDAINITVFPNPATQITCIPVECPTPARGTLVIRNIQGTNVATLASGVFPAGRSNYFFDASGLVSGCYIVSITTESDHKAIPLLVN